MNTGFGVAGMISPVAFGYLIQSTGSYEVPFAISAVLLAVGVLCSFFIDPTRKLADPLPSSRATQRPPAATAFPAVSSNASS